MGYTAPSSFRQTLPMGILSGAPNRPQARPPQGWQNQGRRPSATVCRTRSRTSAISKSPRPGAATLGSGASFPTTITPRRRYCCATSRRPPISRNFFWQITQLSPGLALPYHPLVPASPLPKPTRRADFPPFPTGTSLAGFSGCKKFL